MHERCHIVDVNLQVTFTSVYEICLVSNVFHEV